MLHTYTLRHTESRGLWPWGLPGPCHTLRNGARYPGNQFSSFKVSHWKRRLYSSRGRRDMEKALAAVKFQHSRGCLSCPVTILSGECSARSKLWSGIGRRQQRDKKSDRSEGSRKDAVGRTRTWNSSIQTKTYSKKTSPYLPSGGGPKQSFVSHDQQWMIETMVRVCYTLHTSFSLVSLKDRRVLSFSLLKGSRALSGSVHIGDLEHPLVFCFANAKILLFHRTASVSNHEFGLWPFFWTSN